MKGGAAVATSGWQTGKPASWTKTALFGQSNTSPSKQRIVTYVEAQSAEQHEALLHLDYTPLASRF